MHLNIQYDYIGNVLQIFRFSEDDANGPRCIFSKYVTNYKTVKEEIKKIFGKNITYALLNVRNKDKDISELCGIRLKYKKVKKIYFPNLMQTVNDLL